jgi:hypothetical protein
MTVKAKLINSAARNLTSAIQSIKKKGEGKAIPVTGCGGP